MTNAANEIAQLLETVAEGFDARIAVALASEEAADLSDQAEDVADRRRYFRWLALVQDIGAGPFGFGEELTCIKETQ